jgi:hypothetical protein
MESLERKAHEGGEGGICIKQQKNFFHVRLGERRAHSSNV